MLLKLNNIIFLYCLILMNLCKYSNYFGEPGKEAHSYRVLDIAIVDAGATIVIAYILAKILNVDFLHLLVFLFLLGIILHRVFCVRTTIDKLLFPC